MYLPRWVFLCYGARKSSLLLLLPPWLSAGFPSVKRGDACLSAPSLVSQRGWQCAVSRPGLPADAWPHLSCAASSLSFLGCPRFCVAPFLRCLRRDAFPKGPALRLGHTARICPDVLAFCTSLGPWGAVVWGGCCPNSQLLWAVTLWTSYCLVWAISPVSAVGLALACCRGQPRSHSRVLSPLRYFFWTFFAQQKNASAGSSTGKTLPKVGRRLSRTEVQPCFLSFRGTCLGLGGDSSVSFPH